LPWNTSKAYGTIATKISEVEHSDLLVTMQVQGAEFLTGSDVG